MKKLIRLGFIFSLIVVSQMSFGQQRWFKSSSLEFGIIGGFSHYSGDLTQSFFETRGFKPSVGLITRYTPHDRFTFRLSGQWGGMQAADSWYTDNDSLLRRNLDFVSVLWDFSGIAEWNLKTLDPRKKSGVIPYVFSGISVFKFNPMAQFIYDPSSPYLSAPYGSNYRSLESRHKEWVFLQPLSTEGQQTTEFNERKRYSLTQLAIPLGAGLKFKLDPKWSLGIEYGTRITFTDYLDDVSTTYVEPALLEGAYGPMSAAMGDRSKPLNTGTIDVVNRGNTNNNDHYGIFGITLTYRIMGTDDMCPGATF